MSWDCLADEVAEEFGEYLAEAHADEALERRVAWWREHWREYLLTYRRAHIAAGRCKYCPAQAAPGKATCERHGRYHASAKAKQYAWRKANGICLACGKPVDHDGVRCLKCTHRHRIRERITSRKRGEARRACG